MPHLIQYLTSYLIPCLILYSIKHLTPYLINYQTTYIIPYMMMLLAKEVNWWFPAEQTVYVIRKPKECVIKDGKFVKLVYQDGYTVE